MAQRAARDQLLLPVALAIGLIVLLGIALLPRGGGSGTASPTPSSGVIAGEPGGGVVSTPDATPTLAAAPTLTPAAGETPVPTTTAAPAPRDDFRAQVQLCRSVSNFSCNDEFSDLPRNASTFVALVEFAAARAGDVLVVAITGPGGTVTSDPYTLQGGGEGAYYSTFATSGLPAGSYTVSATNNGAEVATTTFRKRD